VSSRSYLSIGDVLALLRQEFPDVTISKIRFLESQGLVNPERTPSGYRKFYEHDVERLRWVLRQQREHFLPLKVIKGRLEQEGETDGLDVAGEAAVAERAERVLVGRASGTRRELPGFEAPPETARRGTDGRRARPAGPSARPDLARSRAVAAAPGPEPTGTSSAMGATAVTRAAGAMTSGPGPVGRGATAGAVVSHGGADPVDKGPRPAGTRAALRGPGAKPGVGTGAGPAKRSGVSSTRTAAAGPGLGADIEAGMEDDESAPQTLPDDAVTLEELIEASGLDIAAVGELESYGLLCGRVVGGAVYYDGDGLTVARVAAGLARYGVEARHLRIHKLAAEREAGFIEQIVLPLLKQRNPEARQRAYDAVAELTVLGQGLREVLLRTALREQLGG